MRVSVILTGHGEFAQGLSSLVKGVLGEVDNFHSLPYAYDQSSDLYAQQLAALIQAQQHSNAILILTDMKGGTPFNRAMELKLRGSQIEIFTGTNFGMLMAAISGPDEVQTLPELYALIVEQGRDSITHYIQAPVAIEDDQHDGI